VDKNFAISSWAFSFGLVAATYYYTAYCASTEIPASLTASFKAVCYCFSAGLSSYYDHTSVPFSNMSLIYLTTSFVSAIS